MNRLNSERKKEESLRLIPDGKFKFSCHKGLTCFTKCCSDLNLRLTPYDIIRMKRKLKLSSSEFLERYTTSCNDENWGVPVVMLRMNDDKNKSCPFVTPEGCIIYEDRPGACRTYPLGRAASKTGRFKETREFYFIVDESHCLGFNEDKEWTIEEWKKDQGIDQYNEMDNYWLDVIANRTLQGVKALDGKKLQMFYMACYRLDRFKEFVFESKFMDIFDVKKEVVEKIGTDEVELMKFGCRWLKFALFGKDTIKIRDEVLQATRQDFGI